MSNTFDLGDLKKSLGEKYGPMFIKVSDDDTIVLQPLLRIGKERRGTASAAVKVLIDNAKKDKDEDKDLDLTEFDSIEDALDKLLVAVADDDRGSDLVQLLGDDFLLKQDLVFQYINKTSAGEATASSS